MEILRSQKVNQIVRTGLTGKKYNTIADEVVGKHVVVIRINGFMNSGVGNTEAEAIEDAKTKF
jgi:hypothetical protein